MSVDAGQVVFLKERAGEYWSYALVKELPGGFVWISVVALSGKPLRLKDGLGKTFDEAKKQATLWCQAQLPPGP